MSKVTYVEIKDKTNSQGIYAGGVLFNNGTVAKFNGELPTDVKVRLNQNVLKQTDEKAYKAWEKTQEEAVANRKSKRKSRKAMPKNKRMNYLK